MCDANIADVKVLSVSLNNKTIKQKVIWNMH